MSLDNIVFLNIFIRRDGNNQRDSGAFIKGSALAVLDLDGLD